MFNGQDWNNVLFHNSVGEALDIIEVGDILYFSFENGGVLRWDLTTNSELSAWSSANNLHSDSVTSFHLSGNQLLLT